MPSSPLCRRPDLRRALLGLVAAAALLAGAPIPAEAGRSQAPPPPATPTPEPTTDATVDPAPVDEPSGLVPPLAPELAEIEVSSPEFDDASDQLDEADQHLTEVRETLANAARERKELEAREDVLTAKVERAQARVESLAAQVKRLRGELRDLAVASYVSGRELEGFGALVEVDAQRHNDLRSQAVMVDRVNSDLVDHLRGKVDDLGAARTEVTLTTATRNGIRARIREVKEVQAQAGTAEEQAARAVFGAIVEVETWRRLAEVDGTDIPLVALDAYIKGAQIAALQTPDCGIPWWALAGIGKTESHHGSSGGAEVRADGSLTKPILGIPLDGRARPLGDRRRRTATPPDRAAGPDAVHHRHLDALGGGRERRRPHRGAEHVRRRRRGRRLPVRRRADAADDDLRRGYFSYNHSPAYVEAVLTRAHDYRDAIELTAPD